MGMSISYSSASACCDAYVDRSDVGGAGKLIIYDGTRPANADTAVTTQSPLVTFTCANPAFGSASNGVATANSVAAATAANSGTATWFRHTNYNGSVTLGDGDVRATTDPDNGENLVLSSKTITAGGSVSVTSWTITMPRS